LPAGEFNGLLFVCVSPREALSVSVEDGDLIVVMLPPFVRREIRSASRLHGFSLDSRLMSAGIESARWSIGSFVMLLELCDIYIRRRIRNTPRQLPGPVITPQ
jgi:hypothetical protein